MNIWSRIMSFALQEISYGFSYLLWFLIVVGVVDY
jgi:hypothetical protein